MLHTWAKSGLCIYQEYTGLNIATKPKYGSSDLIYLTQARLCHLEDPYLVLVL